MRHKYATRAIVLGRYPLGEASAGLSLLTRDLGLVRARAQSIRQSGAKLSSALSTLHECDAVLVRGKESWRVFGAVSSCDWFHALPPSARPRAARVASLILRMVGNDTRDPALFGIFTGYLEALSRESEDTHDAAECLAALRILHVLGLDAGEIPGGASSFDAASLLAARDMRRTLITRVNQGIGASGL